MPNWANFLLQAMPAHGPKIPWGMSYKPPAPTEKTPLTSSSGVNPAKPSLELAMTRSRLRLLRTPQNTPWSAWGLVAPFENFELLGAGAAAQVRIAGQCFYLMCFLCLFALPLMSWDGRVGFEMEQGTAAGWGELRWGQVMLDAAISTTFLAFIAYHQYRLMDTRPRKSDLEDKAHAAVTKAVGGLDGNRQRGSACLPTSKISPEFAAEVDAIPDVGPTLRDGHLVEACSVVVSGWGRGVPLPEVVLDELTSVAGAAPVRAVQAARCLALELESEKLDHLTVALAEARGAAAAAAAKRGASAERIAKATAKAAALEAQRGACAARAEVLLTRRGGLDLPSCTDDDLLDHAFVTFGTSEARARIVAQADAIAARLAARGVGGGEAAARPQPHHHQRMVVVVGAPNPGDVAWRNLEATAQERYRSSVFFLLFMYPMAVVLGTLFSFFCVVTPLLNASPFAFHPTETYWLRFGYFLAIVSIYAITLQSLIQPLFASFLGKGFFGVPALRITSNTYTCMHAKVGGFWLLVELVILSSIYGFYVFLTVGDDDDDNGLYVGKEFAYHMTEKLGTPKEDINFYRMWNTECMMNILMACVAECFVASWWLPAAPQYLLAPLMSTQKSMDEWVRIRNPAVLPFTISDTMRILAVSMWWSGIFPIQIPCAAVYYVMAVFVARSNLLGRIEPGPPTKPLLHRLTFGVYLPLHLFLRFLFTAWIYMDVPLPSPQTEPFGNLTMGHWHDTPTNTFHFVYAVGATGVLFIALPLCMRRLALRRGVLTPWQLLKLWVAPFVLSQGLEDRAFAVAAKVTAGMQSLALAAHTSVQLDALGERRVVVLPAAERVHLEAWYRAPNGLDLLAKPGKR